MLRADWLDLSAAVSTFLLFLIPKVEHDYNSDQDSIFYSRSSRN